MRSSRTAGLALLLSLGVGVSASIAEAQQQPQGFAVDRLYRSAPGGGWMVMDDLDLHGGLGGAVAISGGYAHDPFRVTDGVQRVNVVADDASFDLGLAVTYDRFRLYLNLDGPIAIKGSPGVVGNYQYVTPSPAAAPTNNPNVPSLDISTHSDTLADARVGFDARLLGDPKGPFRLGASAQLYIPSGGRENYLSDGTYRAMLRVLAAGNLGRFTYAGQLGVHIRPLDDSPAPGSPQGSELLFGVAGGPRFPLGAAEKMAVVIGPEIYGESALKSLFGTTSTGVEALATGRIEETGDDGRMVQVKAGVGGGLNPHFGAPEWRFVLSIVLFDHSTDTDGDGIFDGMDACPHVPGVRSKDLKANGCPVDRDGDGVSDPDDACPDVAGPNAADPTVRGCPSPPPPASEPGGR